MSEREWGEGPEGDADVLAYINETPTLLSLLYDLNLLPEQHPDHESEAWEKIFTITNHWREAARELHAMRDLPSTQAMLEKGERKLNPITGEPWDTWEIDSLIQHIRDPRNAPWLSGWSPMQVKLMLDGLDALAQEEQNSKGAMREAIRRAVEKMRADYFDRWEIIADLEQSLNPKNEEGKT